jgi:multidrug transporter EmrE-like cation transporter
MRNESASLILLVLISIVNTASQILMRWGGVQAARSAGSAPTAWRWLWVSRWWLCGIVIGWIAGLGWAWCLRRLPLGIAIPLYAGLVYVLTVVSGAYFLKERMGGIQIAGIATILIGILLVTLASVSASAAHLQQ